MESKQHRIVTYNILSPSADLRDLFSKCDPENLDPLKRLQRIKEKLDKEVHLHLCLGLSRGPFLVFILSSVFVFIRLNLCLCLCSCLHPVLSLFFVFFVFLES
jgi:hypothetical protein